MSRSLIRVPRPAGQHRGLLLSVFDVIPLFLRWAVARPTFMDGDVDNHEASDASDAAQVAVHAGVVAVQVHLAADLPFLLGNNPEQLERAPRRTEPFRRRVRRRVRAPPGAVFRQRRRRAAGGAHAEADGSSSGYSDDSGGPQDLFEPAGGGAGGGGSGDSAGGSDDDGDADEEDVRPRTLASVDYYSKVLSDALTLALDNEPQPDASRSSRTCRAVAVAGGAAVIISEGEKAFCVWLAKPRSCVLSMCSCGGRRGAESVEMRYMLDRCSSCVHARALLACSLTLALSLQLAGLPQLLERFPVLDNALPARDEAAVVYYGTNTAKYRGAFAVLTDGLWSSVVIRPRLAVARSRKRMLMRAACTQLSCAKRHWWCRHARAVTAWCTEALGIGAAAAALGGLPPGVQLVDVAGNPVPTRGRRREQGDIDGRFADETRWRAARNMLPCDGEIDMCALYDKMADLGRDAGEEVHLPMVLFEDRCFKCTAAYRHVGVKNTGGVLHTLRGRISVRLLRWTCVCGTQVPFDGAQDGLFASTLSTVFTRTYMDVMAQSIFTGNSTLSSAAGVMCFLLESTKSLSGALSTLTRQTLIKALHRFSRTLIVPAALFRCDKCYLSPQRPYPAVIMDGQVISVQRNQSEALMRVEQDLCVVAMDTGLGACIPLPALRGVIRRLTRSDRDKAMRLSKADEKILRSFFQLSVGDPDPYPAGPVRSRPGNIMWAASYLFRCYYSIEPAAVDDAQDHDAAAEPAQVGGVAAGAGAAPFGPAPPGAAGPEQGGAAAPGPDAAPAGGAENSGSEDGAEPVGTFTCAEVEEAVGVCNDRAVASDRWRVVRDFFHTFLAEPVVGALAGLNRGQLRRMAAKQVTCTAATAHQWKRYASAAESVLILSPFLLLMDREQPPDPLKIRAVGELLLFTCGVDAHWETMWRGRATPAALEFEDQWKETSAQHYATWLAARPGAVPPPVTRLSCEPHSQARALAQALECVTGHVWPELEPVRPFIVDSKANAVNAARAAKAKVSRAAIEAELVRVLGADSCRHTFVESDAFLPGIENFLCPCGTLLGFDFLERAESPAHVLASLVQHFPLLPRVMYYDTACQLARNASRRVPWLVNTSDAASSVDRAHNTGDQHKCSDIYDADRYPSRSVAHSTTVAESRHAIYKTFTAHLSHLRQDHFIVQMRLLSGVINARVLMRRAMGKETSHRLLCRFYHRHIAGHCQRRLCSCHQWREHQQPVPPPQPGGPPPPADGAPPPPPVAAAHALPAPVPAAPGGAPPPQAAAADASAAPALAAPRGAPPPQRPPGADARRLPAPDVVGGGPSGSPAPAGRGAPVDTAPPSRGSTLHTPPPPASSGLHFAASPRGAGGDISDPLPSVGGVVFGGGFDQPAQGHNRDVAGGGSGGGMSEPSAQDELSRLIATIAEGFRSRRTAALQTAPPLPEEEMPNDNESSHVGESSAQEHAQEEDLDSTGV